MKIADLNRRLNQAQGNTVILESTVPVQNVPTDLHERCAAPLALMLQLGIVLEQQVRHVGVPVLTGVGQGRVTRT